MKLIRLEPEQVLKFSPSAPNGSANRTLRLTNITNNHVAFKVKTTAPKSYLVRPSSGTMSRGDSLEIQITLQPGGGEEVNQHRFLVQAMAVSSSVTLQREDWTKAPKDSIEEQRLSVTIEATSAGPADAGRGGDVGASGGNRLSAPPSGSDDLKVKYDELVQYTLLLEKEKKKLEGTVSEMKSSAAGGDGGISKIAMLLALLLAAVAAYSAKMWA